MENLSQTLLFFFSFYFLFIRELNQEVDKLHDFGVVFSRFSIAELYSAFSNEIILAAFEGVHLSDEVEQPLIHLRILRFWIFAEETGNDVLL